MSNASSNEMAERPAEPIIFLRARKSDTRPSRDLVAKLMDIEPVGNIRCFSCTIEKVEIK